MLVRLSKQVVASSWLRPARNPHFTARPIPPKTELDRFVRERFPVITSDSSLEELQRASEAVMKASKTRHNKEKALAAEDQAASWNLFVKAIYSDANKFPPRAEHMRHEVYENAKELWINMRYYDKIQAFDIVKTYPDYEKMFYGLKQKTRRGRKKKVESEVS